MSLIQMILEYFKGPKKEEAVEDKCCGGGCHEAPVPPRRVFDEPQGAISIGHTERSVRIDTESTDNSSLQESSNSLES